MTDNPFHPFKAVAIDLDGTLLSPDLTISQANLDAIDTLASHGLHIILASGRHYTSMLPHARKIPQIEYLVSSQGAFASDIENVTKIFESYLPLPDARSAIEFGLEQNLSVVIYTASGLFTLSEGRWLEYYSKLAGLTPTPSTVEDVLKERIFKVVFFEEAARLDEVEGAAFLADTHLYKVRTLENIFELADPKTSKKAGLEALLAHMELKPEELASFGDGNNDIPMFELSGFSAAMDHGWPAARRAATLVVPEGDPTESFARAVEAFKQHCQK